jgi:hypothetical protein
MLAQVKMTFKLFFYGLNPTFLRGLAVGKVEFISDR